MKVMDFGFESTGLESHHGVHQRVRAGQHADETGTLCVQCSRFRRERGRRTSSALERLRRHSRRASSMLLLEIRDRHLKALA